MEGRYSMPSSCQSLTPLLLKLEMPVVDTIETRSEICQVTFVSNCLYVALFHWRHLSSQSGLASSRKHQLGIVSVVEHDARIVLTQAFLPAGCRKSDTQSAWCPASKRKDCSDSSGKRDPC